MSRLFSQKTTTSLLSVSVFSLLAWTLLTPSLAYAANPIDWALDAVNSGAQQVVWWLVSTFFGFLVYATGSLLDLSIGYFIVNFGELFRSSGLGAAVNNLWMVVRDVFNLLFIFGLIYAGFNLIINSDEGGVRKTIKNLIIAALLINFSLFITKTIIDFGNIAAVQVAKVLYESAPAGLGGSKTISGAFLYNMGATGLFSPTGREGAVGEAAAAKPGWIYIFGSMFLLLIAAFAFVVGAVLISIRFIMLNYYMVISPVMFLGKIVPKFSSYTSSYWKDLLANVFFAPAFLLLLYFSLYILGSIYSYLTRAGGGGSLYAAFATPQGSETGMTTILMFLMAAGFLLASVVLAKKMGAVGGEMAVSVGQDFRKRGQRALGSVSGYYGRKYIGKYAAKYDKHLEGSGLTERSWRRSLASSVAKSKYGGSYTYKEAKDQDDKAAGNKARADAVTKISQSVKTVTNPPAGTTVTPEQRIKMERDISGASNEQILKVLGGFKEGTAEYKAFIASLSSSQYDALMKAKEEDLNDKQKAKIAETRNDSIQDSIIEKARSDAATKAEELALSNGLGPVAATAAATAARNNLTPDAALNTGIKKASLNQLKVLGEKKLTDDRRAAGALAGELTFSQIDDIKKSSDFTETEKDRIVTAHAKALQSKYDVAKASHVGVKNFLDGYKDEDIAKLPRSILTSNEIVPHLTIGRLSEMTRALTPDLRATIKNNIINNAPLIINQAGAMVNNPVIAWFNNTPQGQRF